MSNLIAKWNSVKTLPPFNKRVIVAIQGMGDYPRLVSGSFYEIPLDSPFTYLIGLTAFQADNERLPYTILGWKEIGLRYWMEIPELPKE